MHKSVSRQAVTSLHDLSAVDLIAGFRAKQFSPSEVLEDVLAHIAVWEPHINALYAFDPEGARASAKASNAAVKPEPGRAHGTLSWVVLPPGRTGHARHIGVQPGLELEEVQVPPRAAQPVVHRLRGRAALWARQQRTLAAHLEVDAALDRLKDGTFGICENCGKPIPIARLKALPWTTLCIDCAGQRKST